MKKYSGFWRNSGVFAMLSLLLALVMVAGLLPHGVLAGPLKVTPRNSYVNQSVSTNATTPVPPTVQTILFPLAITSHSAVIEGSLIDLGSAERVLVSVEYGEDVNYGASTTEIEMLATGTFAINLLELKPETTYHYRAKATGAAGGALGQDASFSTLSEVSPAFTPSPDSNPTLVPAPSPTSAWPVSSNATPSTLPTSANITLSAESSKIIVKVSSDKDTEIESASGKIKLKVPKGAVSTNTTIEMTERAPFGSTGMRIVNLFELTASDSESGARITNFAMDLQITITHTEGELVGLDTNSLRLYYLDEITRVWLPVKTSHFDKGTGILTAATDHFTQYGEQANPLINGPGRVMASEVSLYSGAAVFSYPLELPPGPGGFKPKLELSYNSGSVDEMKNKRDMGSWVGTGWTLNLGRISGGGNQYYLELNGASYELLPADGATYYTNPDQHFKITRSANTWNLYDRDGNHYRFGGTADSQQYTDSTSGTYYRWDLSLMEDTNNNQATVEYTQNKRDVGLPTEWVRSAYPLYLKYNGTLVQITFNSSSYETNSRDGELRYDSPASYPLPPATPVINWAPKIMETRKLDSIEIRVSGNLVRKYTFDYSYTNRYVPATNDYGGIYYAGTFKLDSITQVGADGSSQLPSMTFTYENKQTYLHDTYPNSDYTGNPGNPASFEWPHLTVVNSGYGGSVTYAYTQTPSTSVNDIWTREVVTTRTTNPGIGPPETHTYTYTGYPQYLEAFELDWDAEYRGFSQVRDTDAAGNYSIHYYYTTSNTDESADRLTGREYRTEWYNNAGGLLRRVEYDWDYRYAARVNYLDRQWGSVNSGSGSGQFYIPYGVAAGPDGYVYVADTSNHRVQKFTALGVFVSSWGSYGSGDGQFISPVGVTVSNESGTYYVYVADSGNHRVQKWSTSGVFQGWFGKGNQTTGWHGNGSGQYGISGTGDGQFNSPSGVTASNESGTVYIYVADSSNHRIQKFRSDIVFQGWFGRGNINTGWHNPNSGEYGISGTGDGQFNYPRGVSPSSDGSTIYVADTVNCRVQKFQNNGSFLLTWGSAGSGDSQFDLPSGLAVDGTDYVFVVDSNNSYIKKFNSSGTFLLKWGGFSDGRFVFPRGAGVDSNANLYVMDTGNHHLQKFSRAYEIYLSQVDEITGSKVARTRYLYDSYGNAVTQYNDGDTSTNTDDSTVHRVFYPNTTANILSKPARERIYATISGDVGGDNLKAETQYYYDNNNTSLTTPPSKGNLTRLEQKKNVSDSISSYNTYDTWGNKLTEQDPNGNTISWTYDTTYHTYPSTKTYPVSGLDESYTYDIGTNNLLTQTDVNDQVTYYGYDTFKRLTSVDKPLGQNPDIQHQYNGWGALNSQNIKTITWIDISNSLWSADYFDGLGRVVQTHSTGLSGRTIISGTTTYNNRGLVDKHYVSQDIGSVLTAYYTTGIENWKYTSYSYDGLGRVLTQTNADGTTVSSNYATPWQTTTTNARGFQNTFSYDAFGRLTQVQNTPGTSVSTMAATSVTATTATLNGNLSALGLTGSVTVSFEWGLTTAYGNTAGFQVMTGTGNFNTSISGLSPNTTYHFRARASDGTPIYGTDQIFVTGSTGNAPVVTTNAASSVTATTATLNGNLTSKGTAASVTVNFEWGLTTAYGNTTAGQPMTTTGIFTANLSGLTPNTVYHYRAKAVGYGTVYGNDMTFTTASFATATFGLSDASSTYSIGGNYLHAQRFQNTVGTGTLTRLELLVNDTTPNEKVRLGVFADNAGVPVTLLLDAGEVNVVNGWVSISGLNLAVTQGAYYWLTFTLQNSNDVKRAGGAGSHYFIWYAYGSLPSAFPTGASSDTNQYVMRATVASPATPTTGSTKYTYDTLNLAQVVDYNGNISLMSYDRLSRKTSMLDPDMGGWYYGYDKNGNLTSQLDNKGKAISMVYDALNRLTSKNYPAGSGMTNVSYAYDSTTGGNYGKGKRTGMSDYFGASSHTWKYDARGRLIREDKIVDSTTYTTQYSHDGADRIVTITYPTNEVVTQTYNLRGLSYTLSGSTAGSLVTSVLYNQLGNMTEINLWNTTGSTRTTYGYWGTGGTYDTTGGYYGRLWEIRTTKQPAGTPVLQDIRYTWDAGGNLTNRTDLVASDSGLFRYDYLDRLTLASVDYTENYSYDLIGNILSRNGTMYTYGAKPHAVTAVGSTSYVYDNNGNMTTRGTQTITWDVENKPLTVTGGSTYYYDGDGNRVKEIDGGQTTVYINQYYEKNITTSEVTTHYYMGGKQIAVRKGTTVSYLLQDQLGSTSVIADTAGASTGTIRYYPFGERRNSTGTIPTDKQFTGQRLDSPGLYYYNARYYDPQIGRFISADTVVSDWKNPQALNRYSYVLNNPLKYIDPTGHQGEGLDTPTEDGQLGWTSKDGWLVSQNGQWVPINSHDNSPDDPTPSLPLAPSQPVQTAEPEPSLPAQTSSSGFEVERDTSGAIIVYVPEGSLPAKIMGVLPTGDPQGAAGVTVNPFIFIRPDIIDDPRAIPPLISHERVHIYQQRVLGLIFWPLYGLGALLSHDRNPFEIMATWISGY